MNRWIRRFMPVGTSLRDYAVAVLGAHTEPGRSIALAFAEAGSRLALVEQEPGQHQDLSLQIKNQGGRALTVASIGDAAFSLNGLAAVVFTTGDTDSVSLRSLEASHFESVLRENTVSALGVIQDAVDVLEPSAGASIVAVLAGPGWGKGTGTGAAAAARAATLRTIEALRGELADCGLHLATVVSSQLSGWEPSHAQIATATTMVVSLKLKGIALPPGSQALEALVMLAPEPLASVLNWVVGPAQPLTATSASAQPRDNRPKTDPDRQAPKQQNRDAVKEAVIRAAAMARSLDERDQEEKSH